MKKIRLISAVLCAAVMLTGLSGCSAGLENGKKRMDQIANGETTVPVIAPQTVAQPKKTDPAATSLNIDAEKKLLENYTVESFEPQEIPTAMQIEGDSVDLTKMSATVCYAQVLDIISYPENYLGKTITMDGLFSIYESPTTGNIYYACIIQDATACCTNGIEFICKDARTYPQDYPELGTDIKVVGTFETYMEDEYMYCRVKDATLEIKSET